MDCSPPGSCVHGILQARILKWVAISFSRGSARSRDQTWVICITSKFFTIWATTESLYGVRKTKTYVWEVNLYYDTEATECILKKEVCHEQKSSPQKSQNVKHWWYSIKNDGFGFFFFFFLHFRNVVSFQISSIEHVLSMQVKKSYFKKSLHPPFQMQYKASWIMFPTRKY